MREIPHSDDLHAFSMETDGLADLPSTSILGGIYSTPEEVSKELALAGEPDTTPKYDQAYEQGLEDGGNGIFNEAFAAEEGYLDGQTDASDVEPY
mgnify:FL=1